jgi:hypothetical protein
VSSYRVEIYSVGAVPGVAAALATRDLGKPPVVSGECTVDVTDMVASLPGGSYFAVVVAVGSGGETRSTSSPTFTQLTVVCGHAPYRFRDERVPFLPRGVLPHVNPPNIHNHRVST